MTGYGSGEKDARPNEGTYHRGFESENRALAEAREDAETFGYSLADLCPCPNPAGAHLRKAHEAAVVVPGEYDSDDLDRIVVERDRRQA